MLQDIERKLADLQKQIADVPNKVIALQEQREQLNRSHEERLTHRHELARQMRSFEGELDVGRAKLAKLKDQLMSVKTNKEYTAMLHEIQAAEAQIRAIEDKILDNMEESESLEQELLGAEKELEAKCAELQGNIQKLESLAPELEAEVIRLMADKGDVEATVEPSLLQQYRRIAGSRKGVALAEAKDELCSACHVRIRPQVYADLLRSDVILTCDSCSRILYPAEVT